MNYFRYLLIWAVLALGLTIGLGSRRTQAQQTAPSTASPQRADPVMGTVRITLLHLNDVFQAAPVDRGQRGGLARVAALRRRIKAESPNTLFLFAGSTLSPSVQSNVFKGEQMIAAWNAAGLDYAVFGNNEFDFGPDVLRQRMNESRFVWLGSNVFESGKSFGGAPLFVLREFGGIKIGLFGLLTRDTEAKSSPSRSVEIRDPCTTAKDVVARLRTQGARVVIALTHLTMSEDKALARCAPIDVIIGGYEHTLLQSLSGRTPIFKMDADARTLGRIDLNISLSNGTLESVDWQVIPVTGEVADEPQVATVVSSYEKKLIDDGKQAVGRTSVKLDALRTTNLTRETNLGSFLADAYRQQVNADVALVNAGAVQSNTTYGPGQLTKQDILAMLPYVNQIVKVEATGAQLRAALEHGVSLVREANNFAFLQVSGLRMAYDGRRPNGSRVVNVTVNGRPLEDKRTYTLATNPYILNGGDGYTMFKGVRFLIRPEQAQVETTVLIKIISTAGEIAPQTDGRIERLDR
jgi:5'-nucleotidase